MARKGQFKKGGGRVGGGPSPARGKQIVVIGQRAPARRRATRSVAIVAPPVRHRRQKRHHRGGGRIVGGSLTGFGAMAAGMAWIDSKGVGDDAGMFGSVNKMIDKLPGAKTLGRPATAGLALGAIEHFTKFGGRARPYMKLAGVIGVVLAGAKIGGAGAAFKWLGDVEDDGRPSLPIAHRRRDPFDIDTGH